jgi:o-succinylbenzoate synthase
VSVLTFHPYQLKLSKPYRWAKGVQTHRTGFVVRMAHEGVVGWGEAALLPHIVHDPHKFAHQCELLVDGLNALDGDFLAQLDQRECPPALRCGISSAYLSHQAAARGQRFAEFLAATGPVEDTVRVNALVTEVTPAQCVQATRDHVAAGIHTIKLKCGKDRRADLARVEAIRNAFPALKLRIDPNQSWDEDWAADHLRDFRPFDLQYCEEPLAPGTPFDSYRRLRELGGVPIALDESIVDRASAELAIDRGAADYFVLKLQRLGGPDRLLDVAGLARSRQVPTVLTSSMETTIGLAVGLHAAALVQAPGLDAGLATSSFFAENLAPALPVVEGCMALPPGPGLGVSL